VAQRRRHWFAYRVGSPWLSRHARKRAGIDGLLRKAVLAATVTAVVGVGSAPAVGADRQQQSAAVSASVIPAKDSPELAWWRGSMKTHDQRMKWWREARFGMFIHWGVYSELAGEWHGEPVQGYAEHIMRKCRIPIETYKKEVAGRFNPTKFNADEWAQLAKDAGFGYMVITSKHHDGFAMFDSDASDFNVVKQTPWKRDPMKELKEATTKQGVKFGFYYSQAWDWSDPNAPGNDWDFENPAGDRWLHGGRTWWESSPDWIARVEKYVDGKAIPQMQELVHKYHPDVIWFDTNSKMPPSLNLRVLQATRAADPNAVINSRCVANLGDYLSTADRPAEFAPQEGDWEGIPTTNESYGYHKGDQSHKPPEHFITLIAKAAARGGNLMLNVGPRGDGTIDPADVAILRGIGKWMKVNGDSIHGTSRTPLPVQAWGESTQKGHTLYLHVFNWPSDGKLTVGGLKSKVVGAHLLADPAKRSLNVERLNDLDVRVDVPSAAPDKTDSVIVLKCAGGISADDSRLLSLSQDNVLRVFDGQLSGNHIKFGQGKKENAYVEQWTEKDASISWQVRVIEPVTLNVASVYDAEKVSAGGVFAVRVNSQKPQLLTGNVQAGKLQSQVMGTVRLEPGTHEVRVEPVKIIGDELMRLRCITLTRAANETATR
jgi:alpha-L-fucosidase